MSERPVSNLCLHPPRTWVGQLTSPMPLFSYQLKNKYKSLPCRVMARLNEIKWIENPAPNNLRYLVATNAAVITSDGTSRVTCVDTSPWARDTHASEGLVSLWVLSRSSLCSPFKAGTWPQVLHPSHLLPSGLSLLSTTHRKLENCSGLRITFPWKPLCTSCNPSSLLEPQESHPNEQIMPLSGVQTLMGFPEL